MVQTVILIKPRASVIHPILQQPVQFPNQMMTVAPTEELRCLALSRCSSQAHSPEAAQLTLYIQQLTT